MDSSFLKKKRWHDKRDSILRRDNYTCQLCKRYGKMTGAHHVHHIFPWEFYPEYAYENWNLISLCQQCHNRMHDRDTHELTAEGKRLQRKAMQWKSQSTKRDIPKNKDGMTY